MTTSATVTVDFAAETAKFTAELKKVNDKLTGMQSSFKSLESVAKGALGFLSASGLTNFVRSSVQAADALGDVAERIGISVEALSQLQFAAQESDIEIETLTKSLTKLSNNLSDAANGVDTAEKSLKALNLVATDLEGLGLDAQLAVIADQFRDTVDPADRVRVATDLFGKGAEQLIPLLLKGSTGMKAFADEADRLGITLEDSAVKGIDRASNAIDALQLRVSRITANLIGTAIIDSFGSGDALTDLESRIDRVRANLKNLEKGGFAGRAEDEIERQKIVLGQLEDQRQLLLYEKARAQAKTDIANQAIKAANADKAARDAAAANAVTDLGTETFGPGFNANDQLNFEIELDDALIAQEQATAAALTQITATQMADQAQIIEDGNLLQEQALERNAQSELDFENEKQRALNRIRQDGVNAAMALYTAFGGKYKKFAQALLIYDKARAIAEIVIETQKAASAAFASGSKINVAVGYAQAALAIGFGAARVAAVAGTFIGGSSAPSLGGSSSNPVITNNTSTALDNDQRPTAQSQRTTQVIFNGPVYNTDDFQRSIVDALKDVSDRDVIIFSGSSAQAQVIRAA